MKSLSIFFSVLSLAGVLLLAEGCAPKAGNTAATNTATTNTTATGGGSRIAFVNIDSLEAHYELLKSRREDFKKRQEQMEGELEQSYQQMQAKGADLQKKAQAQNLTQSEYESAQKQLMLMQQSLESRKQSLTEQLVKEQEEFNKDLKKRLDAYLENYNKDKHYDYILSYSSAGGSAIMYANKALEITKDVIAGMNATSKNEPLDKKK